MKRDWKNLMSLLLCLVMVVGLINFGHTHGHSALLSDCHSHEEESHDGHDHEHEHEHEESFVENIISAGLSLFATPVSADYEDGVECEFCGSWRYDDWKCDNGDHCGDGADGDCYSEHHCGSCGECVGTDGLCENCEFCDECCECEDRCRGCNEYGETVCPECGEKCSGCADFICDECNKCLDCASDELYCSTCLLCFDCAEHICYCGEGCNNCALVCEDCNEVCTKCEPDYICLRCTFCFDCIGGEGNYCEECQLCKNCVDVVCACGAGCSECAYVCPECGEYCENCADGYICLECGICDDCAGGDNNFCHECLICKDHVDYICFCGEGCSNCAVMCMECGEKCENCADDQLCGDCGVCFECVGGEGNYCEECGICKNCADFVCICGSGCSGCTQICPECGEKCMNCADDEICSECGVCFECVGGEGNYCEECGVCKNCVDYVCYCGNGCSNCAVVCPDCAEKCTNCAEAEICGGCNICKDCAGGDGNFCDNCETCKMCSEYICICGAGCSECVDYICPECNEKCSECAPEEICGGCGICKECAGGDGNFCDNCETCKMCSEYICICGAGCSECVDAICPECNEKCSECADDELCVDCGFCIECVGEENFCTECSLCITCVEMVCSCGGGCTNCTNVCMECCEKCDNCSYGELCTECGKCIDCAGSDSFCVNCGLCSDCGKVCPCGEGCENCADLCEDCGEKCSECYDEFCDSCYLCRECAGEDRWCEDCQMCGDCTEICSDCGVICHNCTEYWCDDCERCGDCSVEYCPDCGKCRDCADRMCIECYYCADCSDNICEDCGEYCADCIAVCTECGKCENCVDTCQACELCTECCAEASAALGCEHGVCMQSNEWSAHYCEEGGHCVSDSAEIGYDDDEHFTLCGEGCDVRLASEPHTYGAGKITSAATASSEGVLTLTCTVCSYTKTEAIPKLTSGHTHEYKAVVTKPTCTEGGFTTHTCNCGHSWTDEVTPPTDHSYSYKSDADEHWQECDSCGKVNPVSSHKLGEWKTVKKPGYTFAGEKNRTCKICGYTVTEILPKLTVPENKFVIVIPDSTVSPTKPTGTTEDGTGKPSSEPDVPAVNGDKPTVPTTPVTPGTPSTPAVPGTEETPNVPTVPGSDKVSDMTKELLTKGDDNTVPTLPTLEPTEDGNIFDGWVDKATGEPVKKGDKLTGNVELAPVWKDCGEENHIDGNDDGRCDNCGYIMVKAPEPEEPAVSGDDTTADESQGNKQDPEGAETSDTEQTSEEGGFAVWIIVIIAVVIALAAGGVAAFVKLKKKK